MLPARWPTRHLANAIIIITQFWSRFHTHSLITLWPVGYQGALFITRESSDCGVMCIDVFAAPMPPSFVIWKAVVYLIQLMKLINSISAAKFYTMLKVL